MTSLPLILPDTFVPIVAIGTQVTVGQPLAQSEASDEILINVANELGSTRKISKRSIRKNPGDAIVKGDILAHKRGFFGVSEISVFSNIEGVVVRFERDSGNLVIKSNSPSGQHQNLLSPVDGIIKLCNNEQIVIDIDKNVLSGVKGQGLTGEGEIFILENSLIPTDNPADKANLLFQLESDAIGKVLVGGLLPRDLIVKAIGMGLTGVIGTEIEDGDLAHITERNLTTPVIQVVADDVGLLREWKDKKVYLDGQTKSIVLLQL